MITGRFSGGSSGKQAIFAPQTLARGAKKPYGMVIASYGDNPLSTMKRIPFLISFLLASLLMTAGAADAPSSSEQQQLIAAIKEVQAQQRAIAENQAKIEAKLTAMAESLRMARIYSLRGR